LAAGDLDLGGNVCGLGHMANEIAWRNLSDDGWVTFKAFGLTGISMGFALLTIQIMKKHGNLGH